MSDLQIGLLAVGAVVVIAVLAYNKWQEARYRREAERSLGSRHDDTLLATAGSLATAAPSKTTLRSHGAPVGERIEPTFDGQGAGPAPIIRPTSDEATLSDSIDFIVTVDASADTDGGALIDAAAAALAGFSKPLRLEGFHETESKWEQLRRDTRYTLMRAGLQLVNRQGPTNDGELAKFCAGVRQAAAGALVTVPDRGEAAARATELDKFCGQVDILIAMHVIATATPFAGTKVRALAEANGLRLDDDGRFRRRDDEGRVLFEIVSMDAKPFHVDTLRSTSIPGLTLELDVPRTPDPVRAFEQFRDLAQKLAEALDASIVDEKRSPVSAAAFDHISAQIQAVERAMTARSISPGTPSALRLFS